MATEVIIYRSPCPGCGNDARWVATVHNGVAQHQRNLNLRVECTCPQPRLAG